LQPLVWYSRGQRAWAYLWGGGAQRGGSTNSSRFCQSENENATASPEFFTESCLFGVWIGLVDATTSSIRSSLLYKRIPILKGGNWEQRRRAGASCSRRRLFLPSSAGAVTGRQADVWCGAWVRVGGSSGDWWASGDSSAAVPCR
jgi:hypothetical protein